MHISFRQIRYFIAAAENRKVSMAATVIGISPSAITTAIQDLEIYLGVNLFERHRRGLELTFEGHRFLQHCHNILAAVSSATYAVGKTHTQYSGKLRLGLTITVSGYFIAPLLVRFRRTFPNIELSIFEYKRSAIEQKLVNNDLDMGILLTANIKNLDEISFERLVRSRRRLWVCPNHALMCSGDVSLRDIARFPYIQLAIDEARTSHFSFWKKHNLRPNISFQTDSIEAMRSLVATGMGVTILSDLVYRPWSLEGERIEVISISEDIPPMDVGLVWAKNSTLSDSANALLEFCQMEYISRRRPIKEEKIALN